MLGERADRDRRAPTLLRRRAQMDAVWPLPSVGAPAVGLDVVGLLGRLVEAAAVGLDVLVLACTLRLARLVGHVVVPFDGGRVVPTTDERRGFFPPPPRTPEPGLSPA